MSPAHADEEVVRPTQVEVDLGKLAGNLAAIRSHCDGARVMPILKANAYGHGLLPVARHLVGCGADSLGVAFLEEGVQLRRAGITVPILVLGGIAGEQIPMFLRHDLTLTAPSVEKLRLIEHAAAAGAGDRDALVLETLLAFKRAGCSGVLTYHAAHAARLLNG